MHLSIYDLIIIKQIRYFLPTLCWYPCLPHSVAENSISIEKHNPSSYLGSNYHSCSHHLINTMRIHWIIYWISWTPHWIASEITTNGGVHSNGGIQKWMVYNRKSYQNLYDLGVTPFMEIPIWVGISFSRNSMKHRMKKKQHFSLEMAMENHHLNRLSTFRLRCWSFLRHGGLSWNIPLKCMFRGYPPRKSTLFFSHPPLFFRRAARVRAAEGHAAHDRQLQRTGGGALGGDDHDIGLQEPSGGSSARFAADSHPKTSFRNPSIYYPWRIHLWYIYIYANKTGVYWW